MRKFSKLARSARSHIHTVSSMLLFCRLFVVYSAIPQVIKVNCIDCICIYRCVYVSAWLKQIFSLFFLYKTNYADPVSVCVVLYVIISIQILIRYNVKISLLHAPDYSILTYNRKIPRSVASLPRICHFPTRCPPPPPNAFTHGTPLIPVTYPGLSHVWRIIIIRRGATSGGGGWVVAGDRSEQICVPPPPPPPAQRLFFFFRTGGVRRTFSGLATQRRGILPPPPPNTLVPPWT